MNPLRILSVQKGADTGGQGIRMRQAFERHAPDWSLRVMTSPNVSDYIGYPSDLRWRNQTLRRLWDQVDVLHAHNNFATLRWVERRFRYGLKPTVMHYHGTQFRQNAERSMDESHERQAIMAVSTLDLWLIAPDELEWLPAPYDIDWLASFRKPHGGDKVRISHAPTNEAIKSTRAFVKAMDRLIADGYPVEMDLIERRPWLECLARKGASDIFFDQVILGFGCNSIEAWGMGVPVVSGVDPDRAEALGHPIGDVSAEYRRRFGYLPYYPATEDSIYEALRDMVESPELRANMAQQGKEHVKRYHADHVVVDQLKALYHRALDSFDAEIAA